MNSESFELTARVWLYKGDGPWHFVTIDKSDADMIRKEYIWPRRGFGSIPVEVRIGSTVWRTSIFPDKNGTYVLPLKKEVRAQQKILAGNTITFQLSILN